MDLEHLKNVLASLGNALERLGEVMAIPVESNDIALDATIQRFEFSYELLWKAMKICAEIKGFNPTSPKDTFRTAYKLEWIDDEGLWLDMMRDRNLTAHTYRRDLALEIHRRVGIYYPRMRQAYGLLRKQAEL